MTKLALDLDDEILARLKLIAEREGRSLEDVASDGLAQIVANENELPVEFTPEQIALIEESLNDPRPSIPHEEVMAEINAIIDAQR